MNNIKRALTLIDEHFGYSDRGLLREVQGLLNAHLNDNKVSDSECADNRTVVTYDKMMAEMTPEKLADKNVKLVLVNNTALHWCTSYGQLYPFDSHAKAISDELEFLGLTC